MTSYNLLYYTYVSTDFYEKYKNYIISFSLIFFVLWGIFGETFWIIVFWTLALITFLAFLLLPKEDKRFKTGYKGNAKTEGPMGRLLMFILLLIIVGGVGGLLYDW